MEIDFDELEDRIIYWKDVIAEMRINLKNLHGDLTNYERQLKKEAFKQTKEKKHGKKAKERKLNVEKIIKNIEAVKCPDGFPCPSIYEIAQALKAAVENGKCWE